MYCGTILYCLPPVYLEGQEGAIVVCYIYFSVLCVYQYAFVYTVASWGRVKPSTIIYIYNFWFLGLNPMGSTGAGFGEFSQA